MENSKTMDNNAGHVILDNPKVDDDVNNNKSNNMDDDVKQVKEENNSNDNAEGGTSSGGVSSGIACKGCGIIFESKNAVFRHLLATDGACLTTTGTEQDYNDFIRYVKNQTQRREKCAVLFGYILQPTTISTTDNREAPKNNNYDGNKEIKINNDGTPDISTKIFRNGEDVAELVLHILEMVSIDDVEYRQKHKVNRSYGFTSRNTSAVEQEYGTSTVSELLTVRLPILHGANQQHKQSSTTNDGDDNAVDDVTERWVQRVNEAIQQILISNAHNSSTTNGLVDIIVFGRQPVTLKFNAEMDFSHRRMEYIIPADFFYPPINSVSPTYYPTIYSFFESFPCFSDILSNDEQRNSHNKRGQWGVRKNNTNNNENDANENVQNYNDDNNNPDDKCNIEQSKNNNIPKHKKFGSFPRPDKETLRMLWEWKRCMQSLTTNFVESVSNESSLIASSNRNNTSDRTNTTSVNNEPTAIPDTEQPNTISSDEVVLDDANNHDDQNIKPKVAVPTSDATPDEVMTDVADNKQENEVTNDNHEKHEANDVVEEGNEEDDTKNKGSSKKKKKKARRGMAKKIQRQREEQKEANDDDDDNENCNKKNKKKKKTHDGGENPIVVYAMKRRRYHNFTPTTMVHEYASNRRVDRFYHRATMRLVETKTTPNQQNQDVEMTSTQDVSADNQSIVPAVDGRPSFGRDRPFLALSVSGDLFLTGQVCRLIGLFVAIVRGVIDPDIVECIFDEKYPHLIPTPPAPELGLFACDVHYMTVEGKLKAILTPRVTNRYLNGWNTASIVKKVQTFQEKVRKYVANIWITSSDSDGEDGRLRLEREWTENVLSPWAEKARKHLQDYRQWKAGSTFNSHVHIAVSDENHDGTDTKTMGVPTSIAKINTNVDPTVPEAYKKVLFYLREADSSGRWPSTTPKRQLVMISNRTQANNGQGNGENAPVQGSKSLAESLLRAKANLRSEDDSPYVYEEGQGGASGSFSVGAMPGEKCIQPKSNQMFPELMKAAFELERALCPDREPSSTIAINRNAQFRPHTDSGAGAGQSTSLIVGLGTYSGGELVVEGDVVDIRYKPIEFNGWKQRHWTMPFQGERYSLVWFTPKGCEGVHGIDLCP